MRKVAFFFCRFRRANLVAFVSGFMHFTREFPGCPITYGDRIWSGQWQTCMQMFRAWTVFPEALWSSRGRPKVEAPVQAGIWRILISNIEICISANYCKVGTKYQTKTLNFKGVRVNLILQSEPTRGDLHCYENLASHVIISATLIGRHYVETRKQ